MKKYSYSQSCLAPALRGLLIALPCLLSIPNVSAATIEGRATGSFCCVLDAQGKPVSSVTQPDGTITNKNNGSPQFTISNNDSTAGGTTTVSWGTPSNASNGTINYFTFDGNGSDAGSLPGSTMADSLFQIGTFDYYNAASKQDNISGMTFNLDMQVLNGGMSMSFPTLQFDLSITNTPDNADPVASQDFVSIANAWMLASDGSKTMITGPMAFQLDGIDYEFMLNGFAIVDPTTGLPMLDNSGQYIFSDSTYAYENSLTEAAIFGTIAQVSPVPLPSAFGLFLAGLALLIHRRQKS